MDFNIQLAAKNVAWGDIKIWVPALVGVVVGAALAFFFGYVQDSLRRRREVNNTRSLIYKEVSQLKKRTDEAAARSPEVQTVSIMHLVQLPIFEAHLGRINLLSQEEQNCLLDLYFWIRIFERDDEYSKLRQKVLQAEAGPLEERDINFVKSTIDTIQGCTSTVLDCMERYMGSQERKRN